MKVGVEVGEWGKACYLWEIMLMAEIIDEWVVETLWQLHLALDYGELLTVLIIIIIDSLTYKSRDQAQLT